MKLRLFIASLFITHIILLFLFTGCKKETIIDYNQLREDSLRTLVTKRTDSLQNIFNKRPPKYSVLKLKRKSQLSSKFGYSGEELILTLNRIDKKFLRGRDTLVVPDTIVKNFLYYSPLPLKINGAVSIPKLIVIAQQIQAFGAYEYGNLVKWGPTSTGKKETPTKNGLLHTNWKAKETTSTFNDEWDLKWYFNLDNFEGVSIHQFELPGFPASHACARMHAEDAEWIYNWAEQWIVTDDDENIRAYGTPVIIFGEYDFDSPKIWLNMADDQDKAVISKEKMESLVNSYAGTIMARKHIRDYVIAEKKRTKQQQHLAKK